MPDKEEDMDEFLFVHQSNAQKHLLERYGQEICLLDATYKTFKFDVPLFCVCVSTNSGLVVVGLFILPHETCFHIKRGLAVLKDWNPNGKPTYLMTDYDRKEIRAVEETFPGCFSFLCDFHREQAWKRWVGPANGVKDADEVLTMLRSIANSPDEATYNETVGVLKSSSHWLDNKSL
ncbi:uncharacterized protein LOC127847529 [Dreissena polymorpha]|uniref:uncharacterized protein LOC127847529 n=1 Tax=Dreissena polymorpha TaxID=45954 RepID=UPI0022650151|nr:uncharacterized protein LOC127847529 [Dreissena polymorpha]